MLSKLAFTLALVTPFFISVNAHGAMTAISGSNGVTGQGFGINPATPRDCTKRNPCQQDTSIIRQNEVASGKASPCGRTLGAGVNDITSQMAAASAAGLPAAAADGTVSMTLHQVNGDGAGPYTCQVNADGTGQSFVAMTVSTNVPGKNSRSQAKATDFPLVAQMPAGTNCTGGPNGDACIVRCQNSAIAGPFGGCAAVTNAGAAASSAAPAAAAASTAAASAANSTAEVATASEAAAGGETAAAASAETASAAAESATVAASGAAGSAAVAPPAAAESAAAAPPAAAESAAAAPPAAAGSAAAAAPAAAKSAAAAPVAAAPAAAAPAQAAPAAAAESSQGGAGGGIQNALEGVLGAIPKREVSEEEAEAALAKDLDRRAAGLKRVIKSRVVGRDQAFEWL